MLLKSVSLIFLLLITTQVLAEHPYEGRYVRWDGGWNRGWINAGMNDWYAHHDRGPRVWGLGQGWTPGFEVGCKVVSKTVYGRMPIDAHQRCWEWRY